MLTDIKLLQIKNKAMRILHVPGNYKGGILEMAVVADYQLPKEQLVQECRQIANTLKKQDEVFRNVRLNLIKWVSDEQIIKEVSSLTILQMGRGFEDYQAAGNGGKSLDELLRQLKFFYARSKLILVLTEGDWEVKSPEKVQEYLHPFLYRKLLILKKGEIVTL